LAIDSARFTMCQKTSAPAVFFFFQAEDGIRDATVTGVQTCALPISVLTDANRIMREYMNDRQLHQSAETNRATRVITEDKKPRSVRPHLHQAHSVQDGRHRV